MDKLTEQDGKSLNMVIENLEALKTIFPEAFTEDGVDFDVFRQLLGDEIQEGEEKYGLHWHDKKKARQIALMPSMGTLRPCQEESIDWDTTKNLFIEGDNLEVLKLLQKSYANKIKMIYLDPPYNTGKEFIYPDKFQDNLDTYLYYAGLKDKEGNKTSSMANNKNTIDSARYHTNWLNMMYPRVKLARNLLREDGIIFISIDDNEVVNLWNICNEVFGEENLLAGLIWHLSSGPQAGHFTRSNEVIIAFAKNKEQLPYFSDKTGGTITHGALKKISRANPASEIEFKAGSIKFEGTDDEFEGELGGSEKQYIVDGRLKFKNGILTEDVTLKAGWAMKNQVLSWLAGKDTFDSKGQKVLRFFFNSQGILFYEKERETIHPKTVLSSAEVGGTKTGSDEISNIFGAKIMDFPKPSSLIRFLLDTVTSNSDIVLDYFAGSCPSAQAVLDLNLKETGNRKFIMVQLPEPCDENSEAFKAGFKTIAEIGKERIRRISGKIKKENPDYEGDLGFKVFKLDSSNIRAWNPDRNDLEQTLLDHTEHLTEGRSEEDILYELLLKRGVDLTVPIEKKTITKKTVYSIGYGVLFACLDTAISRKYVEKLAMGLIDWYKELKPAGDTYVVFRDSAFADDVAKTNMTAILEQHGITHIHSL